MSVSNTQKTFALTLDFYRKCLAELILRGKFPLALYQAFSYITEAFLDSLLFLSVNKHPVKCCQYLIRSVLSFPAC